MDDYINIRCELEDCETCFNYPHDGENVGGIIAVEASWFDNTEEGDPSLTNPPQIDGTYTLSFTDPLKLESDTKHREMDLPEMLQPG